MNDDLARILRRNMTETERRLWWRLRGRQLDGRKFCRQAPIGNYIVDFVCFERKLVIEVDGGQHAEQQDEDRRRDEWLNSQGFRVLRFWNHEVGRDIEPVMEVIWRALTEADKELPAGTKGEGISLRKRTVPTPALPQGRGGSHGCKLAE